MKMNEIIVICCVCKKELGRKKVEEVVDPKYGVSHGYCEECMNIALAEIDECESIALAEIHA
jgi:uncharacterized CHY-type Zn-finger protein